MNPLIWKIKWLSSWCNLWQAQDKGHVQILITFIWSTFISFMSIVLKWLKQSFVLKQRYILFQFQGKYLLPNFGLILHKRNLTLKVLPLYIKIKWSCGEKNIRYFGQLCLLYQPHTIRSFRRYPFVNNSFIPNHLIKNFVLLVAHVLSSILNMNKQCSLLKLRFVFCWLMV